MNHINLKLFKQKKKKNMKHINLKLKWLMNHINLKLFNQKKKKYEAHKYKIKMVHESNKSKII